MVCGLENSKFMSQRVDGSCIHVDLDDSHVNKREAKYLADRNQL
jgi:hypothetical protein